MAPLDSALKFDYGKVSSVLVRTWCSHDVRYAKLCFPCRRNYLPYECPEKLVWLYFPNKMFMIVSCCLLQDVQIQAKRADDESVLYLLVKLLDWAKYVVLL